MKSKILLLLKVSRPLYWPITLAAFGIAFVAAGAPFSLLNLFLFLFMSFPFNLLLYGLNDIYDYESDLLNKRKGGLQGAKISKENISTIKEGILFTNFPFFLLISFLLADWFQILLFIIVFFILPASYSCPPIRFRTKPFLDSIWTVFYLLPFFFVSLVNSSTNYLWPAPLQLIFFLISTHALGAIQDVKFDKKVGHTTIAVFLGVRKTALFSALLYLVAWRMGSDFYPLNYYMLLSTIMALSVFFHPKRSYSNIIFKLIIIGCFITGFVWYISNYPIDYVFTKIGRNNIF